MNPLNNYHILIVKYVGQTNTKPSKVKIISERFNESITFTFGSVKGQYTADQALQYLINHGFRVIGMGEGKGHLYFITDTFKPLH
jgi:hypothetical protein